MVVVKKWKVRWRKGCIVLVYTFKTTTKTPQPYPTTNYHKNPNHPLTNPQTTLPQTLKPFYHKPSNHPTTNPQTTLPQTSKRRMALKVEGKLYEKWVPIKIEACKYHGSELSRDMCRDPARMMNDTMIEKFVNCHNYTQCVFPLDKTFEENHGLIHGCVQGHMSELMCSPYDPIFWLHHAFIDLIFEDWLKKHYPDVHRDDPTQAYPSDDVIEEYYNKGSQPMRPFDKSGYKVGGVEREEG